MTFLKLQQHVFRLMRDPNMTRYSLDMVKDWLNAAERQYCKDVEYSVRLSTALSAEAGIREETLPSDFLHELAVFLDNLPLGNVDLQDIIHSDGAHTGTPTSYYIEGKMLGMEPIPTATGTITLVYLSMGGAMVSDNDTPIIPEEHQMLLVARACIFAAIEGDDTRLGAFGTLWTDGIEKAKEDVSKKSPWPVLDMGDVLKVERHNHDVEGMP
jgi:hypothetical protein